jgi:gas vesicle protein
MRNFFLGLGVGLIGGVLLAPRSGEETREYLGQKADEGLDYVKNRAGEAASKAVEQGRTVASDLVDRTKTVASDMLDKGKQALHNTPEADAARNRLSA